MTDGHIVTLTGGYKGTQGKASDLNIFQGGASGVGSMPLHNGFLVKIQITKKLILLTGKIYSITYGKRNNINRIEFVSRPIFM